MKVIRQQKREFDSELIDHLLYLGLRGMNSLFHQPNRPRPPVGR